MTDQRIQDSKSRIAGPRPCVRSVEWPIPGPAFPEMPPADDDAGQTGYVFPTWRTALADSHARIADAYEKRRRMFKAAHEAGLSYRAIGEATGLSPAAVGKILGKQGRASLDSPAGGTQ